VRLRKEKILRIFIFFLHFSFCELCGRSDAEPVRKCTRSENLVF
jgi:hypothetical protein